MPIYHFCEQHSAQWDRLRIGMPTASEFYKIITPKKAQPSEQWKSYAYRLIAERLLQRKVDTYASPAMDRGTIVESEAAEWYYWETGIEPAKVGFVTDDLKRFGCSPDRLLGEDGLLQIKCPLPQTQIDHFINGDAGNKYKPQLQGELYVTGRRWIDLLSWHEELPRIVIRIERDNDYIAKIDEQVVLLCNYIDGVMNKIREVSGAIPEPEIPLAERVLQKLET